MLAVLNANYIKQACRGADFMNKVRELNELFVRNELKNHTNFSTLVASLGVESWAVLFLGLRGLARRESPALLEQARTYAYAINLYIQCI